MKNLNSDFRSYAPQQQSRRRDPHDFFRVEVQQQPSFLKKSLVILGGSATIALYAALGYCVLAAF